MITTLKEFIDQFPTEEKARDLFLHSRWGKWPKCPHCGNERAYFVKRGFRCAAPSCRKDFTVLSKTIFEGTRISLQSWAKMIFIFLKTNGRVSCMDLCKIGDIKNTKTELSVRDKFEFIHPFVKMEDNNDISYNLSAFIRQTELQYSNFNQIKNGPFRKNPFHLEGIDNIGDKKQYEKLIRYIRYFINIYCYWIWVDFTTPEDVLSETCVWMAENGIKEYNTECLLRYIRNTAARMWSTYLTNHPKFHDHRRIHENLRKKEGVRTLKSWYVTEVIKGTKIGKTMTRSQIRGNRQLLDQTSARVKEKRDKRADNTSDFQSHFY